MKGRNYWWLFLEAKNIKLSSRSPHIQIPNPPVSNIIVNNEPLPYISLISNVFEQKEDKQNNSKIKMKRIKPIVTSEISQKKNRIQKYTLRKLAKFNTEYTAIDRTHNMNHFMQNIGQDISFYDNHSTCK